MRDDTTSRRRFIAGGAAGAAGLAITEPAEAKARKAKPAKKAAKPKSVDVCVVGAGLCGLTAARELKQAGLSVHVLEADVRVGGRVFTGKAKDGTPLNYGATFIGPSQDKIAALAKSLGIGTYETWNTGNNVSYFNGSRQTYAGTVPPLDPVALGEILVAMTQLDDMAKTIDTAAPWKAERAREWDSMTFETYIQGAAQSPNGRKLLELVIEALFSVQPRELSLLYTLFYIRSAGNLGLLINTAGGAQERQFEGGSQHVVEQLAATLGKGAVTLNSPVRSVVTKGTVTTVTSDKLTVRARRVLLATPPPLTVRIEFKPGLAALKDQLYQHMPFGSIGKGIAVYDEPFWRKDGLTGQVTSDVGPMKATFDISPASGNPGVMMGFIDGQDARDFGRMSPTAREKACIDQFVTYFGEKARSPKEFQYVLWDELPLHRGCPVSVPGPGVLLGFGEALRERDGARFFASTETATVWNGYMDGAIQAGQDIAGRIVADLK